MKFHAIDVNKNLNQNNNTTLKVNKKGCESLINQILLTIRFFFIYIFLFLTKDIPRFFFIQKKDIHDQIVLITGGAMGIGKSLAKKMAINEKCKVIILDINEKEGLKTQKEITTCGGKTYFYKCNVTNSEDLSVIKKDILKNPDLGRIDILICNAAILKIGELKDLTENDYKLNNDVNILGYILTTKIFIKEMMEINKGQIVFIGSICSFYGDYCGTAYCTAKFAIRGFLESLRVELLEGGYDNIITTIIHPYFVKTSLVTDQIKDPYSTFFDVVSVEECVEKTIDGILKERVEVFIPGRLSILCYHLKCLQTVSVFKEAIKFFNFKHDPL
ncbi:Epidermal retinol dehydrogenase 2 [Strongyloides ratti]|uniref:Epidermal retinol dehydrogenase 2 n=1 Tax=Strongyloides ratti TaxID=34506 RepID=A0A090KU85_STRRB|nr:Epidermal retinol dehydrogenase 2 [Strongyloides ratti]CEF60981.1 Epidermal retinol dehydrogenase 2 [Strongyloides ratti]